jgi:hypothetical protein
MALGEAEVVHGWALANVVRAWVDQWQRERPSYHVEAGKDPTTVNIAFVSAFVWLADKTGLNVRRINGIAAAEFTYVGVTQADAILTAIGKSHYLTNGEINVIPNPNWSRERWVAYMKERGCV